MININQQNLVRQKVFHNFGIRLLNYFLTIRNEKTDNTNR
jgi:hypothetical protein